MPRVTIDRNSKLPKLAHAICNSMIECDMRRLDLKKEVIMLDNFSERAGNLKLLQDILRQYCTDCDIEFTGRIAYIDNFKWKEDAKT